MEVPGTVGAVLRRKGARLIAVAPSATVFDAVRTMSEEDIGGLLVMEGDRLVGVFTERDYTRKIVLMGRVSRDTPVGEVASPAVTVGPSDAVGGAMALMTERRVRHLPVVEGGAVLGVVSIGDLVKWTMEAQTAALDQLQRYVLGQ